MDWTPFIPTDHDVQHSNVADFLACASFSAIHIKEMVVKKQTGQEIDDSERALAKLSGTTHQGNSLQNVVNAINTSGFISVKDWPELVDTQTNVTWEQFYQDIPPEVLAKADKGWHATLRKLDPSEVSKALEVSPVWTIISWGSTDHIVAQINETQYFDSYERFIKDFQAGTIKSQWQLLIINTMNQDVQILNYNGKVGAFVPLATEVKEEVAAFNRIFNINISVNPDGTIPTAKPVKDA